MQTQLNHQHQKSSSGVMGSLQKLKSEKFSSLMSEGLVVEASATEGKALRGVAVAAGDSGIGIGKGRDGVGQEEVVPSVIIE